MHLTTKKTEAVAAKGIFFKNVFNRTTEKKLPSQESGMAHSYKMPRNQNACKLLELGVTAWSSEGPRAARS